jgi:hypothetical protein
MIAKMNTKNLMVFVAIACALFLATSFVSAYTNEKVQVDGVNVITGDASVVAGETVTVEVWFTAEEDDTDVTVEAEFEGEKVDFNAQTSSFDVENKTYKKTLTLEVPYELKDEVSDDLELTITIDGKDTKKEFGPYTVRVQRPSYNADIKSVTVANTAEAGETIPVDFVIKNRGYNDLDDLYVTVSIPALGIEKTSYLDDLVTIEDCDDDDDCDDEDTVSGRVTLVIPYEAKAGIYALEVQASNDDTNSVAVKQIVINNEYTSNIVVANAKKTVDAGETAEYELLLVNPTNKLKVYRVVAESNTDVTSSVDQSVIAVSAGSSKSVKVLASADEAGEYNFNVDVFSGETLTSKAVLSMSVDKESSSIASPIVVLAVILSIVFIVLLIVLVVLITKKPEKAEEFGESYY